MKQEKVRQKAKKIVRTFWSLMLWAISRWNVKPQPADVLVIHPSHTSAYPLQIVIEKLKARGLSVSTTYLEMTLKSALARRPFLRTSVSKLREIPYAFRAQYLISRYQPKIILTHMDSSPYSSSLRKIANTQGVQVVNISHSVTDSTSLYSCFDFDFYFVFGKSSVENALKNSQREGHTKLVLTGSPVITSDFALPKSPPKEPTVCILSDGWSPHAHNSLNQINLIIKDWIQRRPSCKILIKKHPLESISDLRVRFSEINSVEILPEKISLKEAIELAHITVTGWSNASIESAALGRPPVLLKPHESFGDYLQYEKYFGSRPSSAQELDQKLKFLFDNYSSIQKQCESFSRFHLEIFPHSQEFITDCLIQIFQRKINFPTIQI